MKLSPFSSITDAFRYLNTLPSSSLRRAMHGTRHQSPFATIQELFILCGSPHEKKNFIHITGSKGKSTVAHALGVLLEQRGYKTGTFISPHIHRYNERIQINGENVSDELFLCGVNFVYERIRERRKHLPVFAPTFFEFLFAVGCVCFEMEKCDWLIVEVGIGGRFDTTTIIHPKICVITEIEYEHTDILGHTIESIAHDKAGIITSDADVWVSRQRFPTANTIIENAARACAARCTFVSSLYDVKNIRISASTSAIVVPKKNDLASRRFCSPSIGEATLHNQLLAYHIAETHFPQRMNTPSLFPSRSATVLLPKSLNLPARCELLEGNPPLFLDGAHTEYSLEHACSCIETLFSRSVLIFGLSRGKNIQKLSSFLRTRSHLFPYLILTRAGQYKPIAPEILFDFFTPIPSQLSLRATEQEAMSYARTLCLEKKLPLSVLGSFYLCAACKLSYEISNKPCRDDHIA